MLIDLYDAAFIDGFIFGLIVTGIAFLVYDLLTKKD